MIINGSMLLKLEPIKNMSERKVKQFGVSSGLGEAGYDIRLKQSITFDARRPLDPLVIITNEQDVTKQTGRFCIASTIEEFQMPTNLVAVVHDKSTWARRGLSVFNTVIEPGWCGFLTLELVYHGSELVEIPAGAGIAQCLFHQTSMQSKYEGKYQNALDKPQEAIHE